MLIVSKYKDYYDFLVGKWGVDDKLVLDRTKYSHITIPPVHGDRVTLFVCGWRIEGIYLDGLWLYGESIEPYAKDYPRSRWRFWRNWREGVEEGVDTYYVPTPGHLNHKEGISVLKKPIIDKEGYNKKEDCPILLASGEDMIQFPILREYSLAKVFPPEEIWLMISQWLSVKLNIQIPDNQSDKEKIVSHGFDNKTSFRKM